MNFIGLFYLFLLFLISFAAVHIFKLAYYGFLSFKKKPPEPSSPQKKIKEPQPVYYIVEKKRAKKASYSEPKEITFK